MTVRIDGSESDEEQDRGLDRGTMAMVTVLAAAAFMAVLDGTIVGVSLTVLAGAFGSELSTIAWVTVSYLLAVAVSLPVSGWAVDRWGGRRVFLVGLGLFVAGSLLSALAWSAMTLIVFRVLQGLGGGLLEPTSLTLAARIAGPQRVGRVMGLFSMVINVAPAAGPLLGGLLTAGGHWQWIFLINLPVGAVVLIGALMLLRRDTPADAVPPPDVVGMLLLPIGFATVLFAVDRFGAGATGWSVVVPGIVGIALLAGYVRHALTTTTPVLDLKLLRYRPFVGALAVMGLVGFTMYSQLVGLPLFAGEVRGLSGVAQGLFVGGLGVGLLISMGLAGRISDRTGPRPLVRGGAVVTALGFAVFATVGHGWPVWAVVALFAVVGLGFGSVASSTFASVYRAVPVETTTQATTTLFITVQLAASVGVTVIGLLLDRIDSGGAFRVLFWILVAVAAGMLAVSRLLPGRPQE